MIGPRSRSCPAIRLPRTVMRTEPSGALRAMADESFPRELRIRLQEDFDRVYKNDAFAADDVLVLRGCWNNLPHARLGLSVSSAVGNSVVRNRWKRRIREAFRKSKGELPPGLDMVVRPKRGAKLDYDAIQVSLVRLASLLAKRLKKQQP